MLFATGFLTNLGVLPMLTRSTHLARAFGYTPSTSWKHAFFTDEYNHLSLREGIRASGAPSIAYKHLDMDDLERKLASSSANIKIIVTDGVFSQHGDIVPLPDMMALAERHDAVVYIDDAHGTGVLGPNGAGTTEHFGIDSPRIITMGTLSKAYGCIGGFIATESYLRTLLRAGCSAYGFTSTLPPDQAAAVLEAIDMVERRAGAPRKACGTISGTSCRACSPRVSSCCPRRRRSFRWWWAMSSSVRASRANCATPGFTWIRCSFPPWARAGRLRFMMNAHHTVDDIDRLVGALSESVRPATRA